MSDLPKIVSVFGLAWLYFWPSIPAGLALGLSAPVVIVTTALSYASGAAVIALLGGPLRARLMKRIGSRTAAPGSRLYRVWERFGVIGLGLAAPMTVGAQAGAAVGIALNAPPRRLFLWMALGGLLWSIALTALVSLGVLGVQQAAGT